MNHNFIGTEHLLLGFLALGQGVAAKVLLSRGLELEAVRIEVEKQLGTGAASTAKLPYTPRLRTVLARSAQEAKSLNHTYIGTEHLFLGLLSENEGPAALILKKFGVDFQRTREEILNELSGNKSKA